MHTHAPRTYAIELAEALEDLQSLDLTTLDDESSAECISQVEAVLTDHFEEVSTTSNLTGKDEMPSPRYLASQYLDSDSMWVEYSARTGGYESEYNDIRALLSISVIYSEDGELYVASNYRMRQGGRRKNLYSGPLSGFTPTQALKAGMQTVNNHIDAMTRDNLTVTETIDFLKTDFYGAAMENWANDRRVSYEAVRHSREQGRKKLFEAGWNKELVAKTAPTINDTYQVVIDTHNETINELVDELIPSELDDPDHRSVLRVTFIETFAVPMHFDESEVPDYDLFLHKLGEMGINADNFAQNVRMMTEHKGMELKRFRVVADQLCNQFFESQDIDGETKLTELVSN